MTLLFVLGIVVPLAGSPVVSFENHDVQRAIEAINRLQACPVYFQASAIVQVFSSRNADDPIVEMETSELIRDEINIVVGDGWVYQELERMTNDRPDPYRRDSFTDDRESTIAYHDGGRTILGIDHYGGSTDFYSYMWFLLGLEKRFTNGRNSSYELVTGPDIHSAHWESDANRLSIVLSRGPEMLASVTFDDAQLTRIKSLRRSLYKSSLDREIGKNPLNVHHLEFGNWVELGGLSLPTRATLDVTTHERADDISSPRRTTRVLYELISRTVLSEPPDPEAYRIVPTESVAVLDNRLRMSYTIGSDRLLLDGVNYRLLEPLREPPGDRLAELIKTAERMSNPSLPPGSQSQGASGSGELTSDSFSLARTIAIAIGTGLLVFSILWIRQRKVRGTS